jgi:uncharacterized membrane protein YidH (DUF202 family)
MSDAGRFLILLGVVLLVVGVLLTVVGRVPRLPGDILIRRENYTIYVPIATSIVLSVILTILLSLLARR